METALGARLVEKEAEMNEVERKLQAVIDKIDISNRRLPRRPSVSGDQVWATAWQPLCWCACAIFLTATAAVDGYNLLPEYVCAPAAHLQAIHGSRSSTPQTSSDKARYALCASGRALSVCYMILYRIPRKLALPSCIISCSRRLSGMD